MLTQRALEILAKYEILERNLDREERQESFRKVISNTEWHPATKRTSLAGIQGR